MTARVLIFLGALIAVLCTCIGAVALMRGDSFVSWARHSAMPLANMQMSDPLDDLRPIASRLAGVRLIGLGEGTHGTHEFFVLKNRIIMALARNSLTDVLFEVPLPEALLVDAYVQGGAGDPEQLVHGLRYWTVDTQEVVDLIEWLRVWNAGLEATRKIHFRGIDMQFAGPALACASRYLGETASLAMLPDAESVPLLFHRDQGDILRAYAAADPLTLQHATVALDAAAAAMQSRRPLLVARVSKPRYDIALRCLEVARQANARYQSKDANLLRDRMMAANTLWWLEQMAPGTQAVLWAHNMHVLAAPPVLMKPGRGQMGTVLRETLGDDYAAVGFFFGQGDVLARGPWRRPGAPRVMRVPPVSDRHLESVLQRVSDAPYALDLRDAPGGTPSLYLWWPRPARSFGSIFDPDTPDDFVVPLSLLRAFDVVVFAPTTTASTPTATALSKNWEPVLQ